MALIEIIEAPKSEKLASRDDVKASLAETHPDFRVEAIKDEGDKWLVRIAKRDDRVSSAVRVSEFPPKKKDSDPDDDGDDDSVPGGPGDTDDDGGDDDDADDKGDDDKGGDDKDGLQEKNTPDNGEGDALGRLKGLIHEISNLFDELQNKAQETADKADEQQKAVDDVASQLDQHRSPKVEPGLGPDAAETPGDIGPTPGSGAPPAPKAAPGPGAPGAPGFDKRKPPVPGVPSAFSHRKHEVAIHPGVNAEGEKISLTAAAKELEEAEEFAKYEVVSVKEDETGKYVAKLRLRDEQ